MKKSFLLFIGSALIVASCNKGITSQAELNLTAPTAKMTALAPEKKEALLNSMASDPKFTEYMKSLIALQKSYEDQLVKNKSFDFEKSKQLPRPKTETELINGLKSVGFVDPEAYLAKTKEANAKWAELSAKYPLFTTSFTETEKKAFFRKQVDLINGKHEN